MHILVQKSIRTLQNEGAGSFLRKMRDFLQRKIKERKDKKRKFVDVLFINGCPLPHPYRYRVQHQREQLAAMDVSSVEIYYTELRPDDLYYCRTIIIYRCPITDELKEFIYRARFLNKRIFFDIDDLVIDTKYTDLIPYVKNMSEKDKVLYDQGVSRYQATLSLCDGAITTTERLANELEKYTNKVCINRNTASEMMIVLSEKAKKQIKKNEERIVLGYFSGSITHNDDFLMILPLIIKLLKKYKCLHLLLVGELDIPVELEAYKSQIIIKDFVDWKKLPWLIAEADINLVPLLNTVFNEAKSENKWIEAALVGVPTIASNIGAFNKMVEHDVTGMVCNSEKDWENALEELIASTDKRKQLAENANEFVKKHCTTIASASPLKKFLCSLRSPNLAFIFPSLDISGGILVALKHCEILRRSGYDVTVINMDERRNPCHFVEYDKNEISAIVLKETKINCNFDKAVATMWLTNAFFLEHNVTDKYYLVQNFETDFYPYGAKERILANATYEWQSKLKYLTISRWCEKWLYEKFGQKAKFAPNGLDIKKFFPKKRNFIGKIRILIEGDSESAYKNVDESFKIVGLLNPEKYEICYVSYNGKAKSWYRVDTFFHKVNYEKMVDIYHSCHILLKSSILESFSYPPLEMMATGGFVVVRENGGNREYLKDQENCILYDPQDLTSAVKAIENILTDSLLQEKLYTGGVETAKNREWCICEDEIVSLYEN